MNALVLDRIGHAFLGRMILEDVSLAVASGELVALLGPSGAGKSTLAHIAAGLVQPRRGKVAGGRRRLGVVFQEPRLMPWATARENIALALTPLHLTRREREARVQAATVQVALDPGDLDKFPSELSGGMGQRVAIARALVTDPDFLIFDEPFTALDAALRRHMQDIVIETVARKGRAGLFITHDIGEAVRIATRIAVLDTHGRGIAGERVLPLAPGERDERMVFETVEALRRGDPLFARVNDLEDRRIA